MFSLQKPRNSGLTPPRPSFSASCSGSAHSVAVSKSLIIYLFDAPECRIVGSDHKHQSLKHLILFAHKNRSVPSQQLIEEGFLLVLLLIFLYGALIGGAVFIKGKLIEGLVCLEETHVGCDCMKIIIIPK